MDGGLIIKEKPITLTLIIFTFLCLIFLGPRAQALTYCVGCNSATAATCSGADPDNPAANGCDGSNDCIAGTNGVVCPSIEDALDCINVNDDPDATIRIAQGTRTGPGANKSINNTAASDQTINILGGFISTNCTSRTLNPSNTIIQAPLDDRVFHIDNTTSDSLEVNLEGLTITDGDPDTGDKFCTGVDDGGGVCATSTGTGGLIFTSNSNIYDGNSADSGGGLA